MSVRKSFSHIYRASCICLLLLLCACEVKIPPLATNATILTFGDSLTAGNGVADDGSYPAVLASLSGRMVINEGVLGESTTAGVMRLPLLLDAYNPDLLIICHGLNDFLQTQPAQVVEANIRQMIATAQEKNVPVLLLGVPDPAVFLRSADLYRQIAREMNVVFLEDIVSDVLARSAMSIDNIQPNDVGYRVIATEILDILQRMQSI